jgi:hypothetical protein
VKNNEDRPDLPKKHKRKKKAHASTTKFEWTKNLQIGKQTNKIRKKKYKKKLSELFDVPKKKSTAIPSQMHKQERSNVTRRFCDKVLR